MIKFSISVMDEEGFVREEGALWAKSSGDAREKVARNLEKWHLDEFEKLLLSHDELPIALWRKEQQGMFPVF